MRHSFPPVLAWLGGLLVTMPAAGADSTSATPDPRTIEFFEKRVRPVLAEHCFKCHSAEVKRPKGGLLLDTRDAVRKGGDSGPAVVPGKPKESLLVKAVHYT